MIAFAFNNACLPDNSVRCERCDVAFHQKHGSLYSHASCSMTPLCHWLRQALMLPLSVTAPASRMRLGCYVYSCLAHWSLSLCHTSPDCRNGWNLNKVHCHRIYIHYILFQYGYHFVYMFPIRWLSVNVWSISCPEQEWTRICVCPVLSGNSIRDCVTRPLCWIPCHLT